MSVQLRYCERCGVIIPVDMAKAPGPLICENCHVLGEGRTPPYPVKAASQAGHGSGSGAASGGGRLPPSDDPSALAATAPVLRPPTARDFEREEARQRAVTLARRRTIRTTTVTTVIVLLPLLIGGVLLLGTSSGRGFATRGAPGEALERLGEIGVQGVLRIRGLVAGEPSPRDPFIPDRGMEPDPAEAPPAVEPVNGGPDTPR